MLIPSYIPIENASGMPVVYQGISVVSTEF